MKNEKLVRAWVAKLRDPGTRQIRHNLMTEEGVCALGALCDAAVDMGLGRWEYSQGGKSVPGRCTSFVAWRYVNGIGEYSETNYPTRELIEMVTGVRGQRELLVTFEDAKVAVYVLNDREKYNLSFLAIADLIEGEYL